MAVTLARQSRSVILLERSLREPNRINGEVMLPGGIQALEKLGLEECLHGIDGMPYKGYQIFLDGRSVVVPYPLYPHDDSAAAEKRHQRAERVEGLSFHNGRFVGKLRAAAAQEANITVVETEVKELIKMQGTSQVVGVKCSVGDQRDFFFAPLTIVADGYRSKFRGEISTQKPVSESRSWALEMGDAVLPSPLYFGKVILGSGFYHVNNFPIGTHETRVFVNVPEGLAAAKSSNGGVSNYMRHHVLPNLPPSIQPAFSDSLDKGQFRCMTNSVLPATVNRVPGLMIAGDALNMRHPMSGSGMTVALNDVVLLRELLSPDQVPDLSDCRQVMQQMAQFHWRRKRYSFVINFMAHSMYWICDANNIHLQRIREGFFEYLVRGGAGIDELAGLLGGVVTQPTALFYHLFAILFFSARVLLLSRTIWELPLSLLDCGCMVFTACRVLFPCIISEATT
ncbi:hypothetical protein E4U55_005657 [Claviceps digitariae]|nr:hypothetical protein E4U55_005657 [Claviceps digitariae]